MKRLIDAYALMKYVVDHQIEFDDTGQSSMEMVDFVEKCIRMQPTIICVSDDFGNGRGKLCAGCGEMTSK